MTIRHVADRKAEARQDWFQAYENYKHQCHTRLLRHHLSHGLGFNAAEAKALTEPQVVDASIHSRALWEAYDEFRRCERQLRQELKVRLRMANDKT